MTDRGDYRSLYASFWDDPDVHALSDAAYRVLTTLKGTLPASGIGIVYLAVLAERCAKSPAQLEAALHELTAPKPNADFGWIVRERNIIWIVNGLRYEPTLTSANKKHRTFLRERLLAPLGERTPIVVAFRRYYAEWFEDAAPNTPKNPINTQSDAYRTGIDTVSKHNSNSIPSQSESNPDSNSVAIPSQSSTENGVDSRENAHDLPDSLTARVLTIWANSAITERWGEQPNPLSVNGAATETSAAIHLMGVDPETVRLSIYRQCRALKSDKPPRTLKYFIGGIEDDWKAELARRDLVASGERPPATRSQKSSSTDGLGERGYRNAKAGIESL